MMDNNKLATAYIRHLRTTEQCELAFLLQVKHEKFGYLDEEIRSVRKVNDNVASLLQHTKNKIVYIIQKKASDGSDKNQSKEDQKEVTASEIEVRLSRNGIDFKGEITCAELLNYRNKLRFVIFKKCYKVVVNAPLVQLMTLPTFIYAKSTVKPSRFKVLFYDRNLSVFSWSKSLDKVEWTEVHNGFHYLVAEADVDHYLKLSCVPVNSFKTVGPMVEVISENVVGVLDIPETFSFGEKHAHTADKLGGNNVRIVSYNILSEIYTDDDKFGYCDPKYLAIDYRKQILLKEILGYNADIVCLQEVDSSVYSHFFKDEFTKKNCYNSIFNKKGDRIPEGLVCIYNTSRLKFVSKRHIVLAREYANTRLYNDMRGIINQNKELRELFLKQHTSLQVTTLKLKETGDVLVIANTHLYYHSEAGHIRLLQVVMILKFISKWCNMLKASENGRVSVIFCGDFNSRPDSGLYHFMTENNLNKCKEELEKIGIKKRTKVIAHDYQFESACGTPEFTNYTETFKGCLDYIFIEKNKMTVTNVVPFPKEEEMSINIALPNKNFPSDHVPLIADVKLTN